MSDTWSNKLLIVIVFTFVISIIWMLVDERQDQLKSNADNKRYEQQSIPRFNTLKKPVILIGKTKISDIFYDIVVKDSNNTFETFTSDCTLANVIGSSKKVGDTLK